MNRRELLQRSATLGLMAAVPGFGRFSSASGFPAPTEGPQTPAAKLSSLKPPAEGSIPVAFLISEGAVVIDFAGPWEVFSEAMIGGRMDLFRVYTVAETLAPIRASGGLRIVPDYTLESAPEPKVIVIPAQNDSSEAALNGIRKSSKTADVTMSVCTGAYVLAQTGLLNGKAATTHHGAYVDFATKFPDVRVKRGVRFVEDGNLASSGGLSCGIDLAFRVVERYFGSKAAEQVAYDMEYQGHGWMNPDSNAVYASVRTSANNQPFCAVCGMDVDTVNGPKSVYKGKTYYFCSTNHKAQFDAAPAKFVADSKP
jgi:transcriptional regulator GlxA family with amidase domain